MPDMDNFSCCTGGTSSNYFTTFVEIKHDPEHLFIDALMAIDLFVFLSIRWGISKYQTCQIVFVGCLEDYLVCQTGCSG